MLLKKRIFRCNFQRYYSLVTNFPDVGVIYSQSNCPFENLAFEDYLYENHKKVSSRLLYLWRNSDTVVLGRHQNTWRELNVGLVRNVGVNICRRKSGGGTVFHDLGNINLTFFTRHSDYNRKENLDFIIAFLKNQFDINASRNEKDDIIIDNAYKVSGTAAKLGLHNAYHHCTLLCNTNLDSIKFLLKKSFGEIETNATLSIPSKTANLFNYDFDFQDICEKFNNHFKQSYAGYLESFSKPIGIQPLDFPMVAEKVQELKKWEWVYGKSPKFAYNNHLICKNGAALNGNFVIQKGVISDIRLNYPESLSIHEKEHIFTLFEGFRGIRFDLVDVTKMLSSFNTNDDYYKQQLIQWFEKL